MRFSSVDKIGERSGEGIRCYSEGDGLGWFVVIVAGYVNLDGLVGMRIILLHFCGMKKRKLSILNCSIALS